ncbi:MAG: hypothetical protein ABIS59_02415 [Candidatus Saccharibacteria bacterium]
MTLPTGRQANLSADRQAQPVPGLELRSNLSDAVEMTGSGLFLNHHLITKMFL